MGSCRLVKADEEEEDRNKDGWVVGDCNDERHKTDVGQCDPKGDGPLFRLRGIGSIDIHRLFPEVHVAEFFFEIGPVEEIG